MSPPLAERMRPKSAEQFIGQEHLMAKGKPIRVMLDTLLPASIILWGPPGTGKTTIARMIALHTSADFHQINAVSSGVREVRAIIAAAEENLRANRRTILFIDEIHRFNKAQQDALLGAVESGTIILIGATTENPSFEIIPALRSRMRTYILQPLSADQLETLLRRTILEDEVLRAKHVTVTDTDFLLYLSGGDARVLYNLLEAAVAFCLATAADKPAVITHEILEEVVQQKNIFFDKAGEEHYNIISAFIKSLRGSDPDAALYWMVRMLEGGEDPLFIARRMLILAAEDIGNASPNALVLAEACFSAVEKIGMPEARIILAQCATYLAGSPKSNAAYLGIEQAYADVRNEAQFPVPLHLRNAPTNFMKKIGYSKGYKYPHDFDEHFVKEFYLPEELKDRQYYFPTTLGQEKTIRERLVRLWNDRKKYRD
jgi:putative ATPase